MFRTSHKALALAALGAAVVLSSSIGSTDAQARGGKEYFAEVYQTPKAMNGYEGFAGAYHCSYVKTPKDVCVNGKCKRIWELLQTCQ